MDFLLSEPTRTNTRASKQMVIKLLSGQEWLCGTIVKEMLENAVDMVELMSGLADWGEWEEDQPEKCRRSQREERILWKILDECDAEQVKKEKLVARKKLKKIEQARNKMKFGKNQPSMMDMLRPVVPLKRTIAKSSKLGVAQELWGGVVQRWAAQPKNGNMTQHSY